MISIDCSRGGPNHNYFVSNLDQIDAISMAVSHDMLLSATELVSTTI